jgi:DNA-binding SARP family transcriptional activator
VGERYAVRVARDADAGRGAGDPVVVSGARQRALLASLLLSANVPVCCDALAEAVWDGLPPRGAATTLRSYIRRLRQDLGPQAGARITACDPGYLISVQEPELDVLGFEAACREAGAARGAARWQDASAAAARALELWRGTPLLDCARRCCAIGACPGWSSCACRRLRTAPRRICGWAARTG